MGCVQKAPLPTKRFFPQLSSCISSCLSPHPNSSLFTLLPRCLQAWDRPQSKHDLSPYTATLLLPVYKDPRIKCHSAPKIHERGKDAANPPLSPTEAGRRLGTRRPLEKKANALPFARPNVVQATPWVCCFGHVTVQWGTPPKKGPPAALP